MATNVREETHHVSRTNRGELLGVDSKFRGCTIWFTGLSGAGKTTLSFALEAELTRRGVPCYGLDGDNCRKGLCGDLGFADKDRNENIRRVGEVSKLFADGGIVSLCSFISPFLSDRQMVREIHVNGNLPFYEVYVGTPLEVCEKRDPKGLYKKARAGQIKGFTGIDSEYQPPKNPDVLVGSKGESIEESVEAVIKFLTEKGIVPDLHPEITELFVADSEKAAKAAEAAKLPKLPMDQLSLQWLQVLAEGWASPLKGFMREEDFLKSLHFNATDPESNQSVPIVLPCDDKQKAEIEGKDAITLTYEGKDIAIMRKPEVYDAIKEERCSRQFGCHDPKHPYIKFIYEYGDFLVGGELEVLDAIKWNDGLDEYRKTPLQLRAEFKKMGADAVYAFQLRNPVHNGHALLMQDTHRKLVEQGFKKPVLLLHPLGGWTKSDDVPLHTRMQQHKAVFAEKVLDPEASVLAIFPSPMMYAGPTEVQWHAKSRKNAGANFYIVGRDPAGMSHPTEDRNLYQAHHGKQVLSMAPGLRGLKIIPFRVAAYNKKKGAMDFFDPEKKDDFMFISGTKMRGYAKSGEQPPDGFMCPSGWKIIAEHYQKLAKKK